MTSGISVAMERMRQLQESSLRKPQRICFGIHAWQDIGRVASEIEPSGSVLVIAGEHWITDSSRRIELRQWLSRGRTGSVEFARCHGEPTSESVDALALRARQLRVALVISVGGGSVMDSGKAVAALATNEGSVEEYLEGGPHGAQPLSAQPLPMIAVPTTAGTGSEMTRNAVVLSRRQQCKRSLRDDRMFPAAALIDPALCRSAPREVTVASGLDAITQLIESAITVKRMPEVTALAMVALGGLASALDQCVKCPEDLEARALMSASASISGACLANSGLGMAHGIAAALGAKYGVGHGEACGMLLPHVMRWNQRACPQEIYRALSALFGIQCDAGCEQAVLIDQLSQWVIRLGLPANLHHLNLRSADLTALSELSMGSSMSGNPVPMTPADIRLFLEPLAG